MTHVVIDTHDEIRNLALGIIWISVLPLMREIVFAGAVVCLAFQSSSDVERNDPRFLVKSLDKNVRRELAINPRKTLNTQSSSLT